MSGIATAVVIECLRYVKAVSDAGGAIYPAFIDQFAERREPELSLFRGVRYATPLNYDPPMSEYLQELWWVARRDGEESDLVITHLGEAVLASHDRDGARSSHDDMGITIHPDSPMDYVKFLLHINDMTGALVVDRYASVESIAQVSNLLAVDRVLTSLEKTRTDKSGEARKASLESVLGALRSGVEVRHLDVRPSPLHDRLVLPADGRGLLLGGSLGGTQVNTVVALSEGMTATLRAAHEVHWKSATPIEPTVVAPDPSTAPGLTSP